MTKPIALVFIYLTIPLGAALPEIAYSNCDGISSPAYFSLYKNKQAVFNSITNADYEQKYDIEWYIGSKSMGSVVRNGGESFILEGSNLSRTFSVTGSYKKNDQWFLSHHKIFPDSEGGIQIRFEDGACDNSFETSPDLKVTVNIN